MVFVFLQSVERYMCTYLHAVSTTDCGYKRKKKCLCPVILFNMSQLEKRNLVELLYRKGMPRVEKLMEFTNLGKSAVYEIIKRINNGTQTWFIDQFYNFRQTALIRGDNLKVLIALRRQDLRLGFRKLSKSFRNQRGIQMRPETVRKTLGR